MYVVIAVLLGFVLVAPAQAQGQVDIGIHLPALPRLVVVPEVPAVQYVPAAPGNLFYYNDQYWVFANGLWHVSRGYNGPWIVIAPQFVPRPVLLVRCATIPSGPDTGRGGSTTTLLAGTTTGDAIGRTSENGRTAPAVATTMTAARDGAGAVHASGTP